MDDCFGLKLVVIRFLRNKNSGHTAYDCDYSPGLCDFFSFHAILHWRFFFSEVGFLVLPQLTITIAFYDLLIIYAAVLGLMKFVVVAHRDVKFRDLISVSRPLEIKFYGLGLGLVDPGLGLVGSGLGLRVL